MTFTVSFGTIVTIASAIIAIGGAISVLSNAKKKLDEPIEDINKKLHHDNERLNTLEMEVDELKGDSTKMLECMLIVLRHMRTNNATGEMAEKEQDLIKYLAKK